MLAFLVDYLLIILYALFLSGISMLVFLGTDTEPAVT